MTRGYKKIIIKIGTHVITKDDGSLNKAVIKHIVDQVAELKRRGIQVIIITSGAMASGRAVIGAHKLKTKDMVHRQVLAAVGQVHLMQVYAEFFQKHRIVCAQVLATKEDFKDRQHYLNMQSCFSALLKDHIVPVVNENDTVAVSELMFTDNDELAGMVASMVNADALVILTSVQGIMSNDPSHPDAVLIPRIEANARIEDLAIVSSKKSLFGRGGMMTKCRVGTRLAKMGIAVYVAHGAERDVVVRLCDGEHIGTLFVPVRRVSNMKKWLAYTDGQEKGAAYINAGAEAALRKAGVHSLLPIGVTRIEGDFEKGDVIKIQNTEGKDVAIGMAQYGAETAREYIGKKGARALVHYDYLHIL